MPRFTFPYIELQLPPSDPFPGGQTVRRPLLVVQLTAQNGKRLQCIAWPDSGADHCVFPLSYAIALGLDPLIMKSQNTTGVGNTGNVTHYGEISIEVNHGIVFDVTAGFTDGLEALGLGLLGQTGFFSRYSVIFEHSTSQFHIDVP
jgi:hypothetical protein